jgi:hypothetical protein
MEDDLNCFMEEDQTNFKWKMAPLLLLNKVNLNLIQLKDDLNIFENAIKTLVVAPLWVT